MRLLVPRGGRGGGLGGLILRRRAAAALAAAAFLLSACGGDKPAPPKAATPTPTPSATPRPSTQVVESGGELAVGITEPNPAFIDPGRGAPPEFVRWREKLQKMRPSYYRLVVDWPSVVNGFAQPQGGCMRAIPPCAGWSGLQDQLAAIASAQRTHPGRFQVMLVVSGTPDPLARPGRGCERAGVQRRSRPPTKAGLGAYGVLIDRIQDAADAAGAKIRYWSPWNEPNHPFFISPQRASCSASAESLAVKPYVDFTRVMKRRLRKGQELVLGETAGLLQRKSSYTHIQEFIRELPRDVVCSAQVYGQHGYVGGPDPVDEVDRALARHDCPRKHEIWMTETGAGAPRSGEDRKQTRAALRRACRNIRKRLLRWHEDPRVTAAFQYTLREDDRFPTGLVTVDLAEAYPALDEWVAWGGEREPVEAAPPSTC